jgi:predicted DsbA family dithiol-disulfide isomerase
MLPAVPHVGRTRKIQTKIMATLRQDLENIFDLEILRAVAETLGLPSQQKKSDLLSSLVDAWSIEMILALEQATTKEELVALCYVNGVPSSGTKGDLIFNLLLHSTHKGMSALSLLTDSKKTTPNNVATKIHSDVAPEARSRKNEKSRVEKKKANKSERFCYLDRAFIDEVMENEVAQRNLAMQLGIALSSSHWDRLSSSKKAEQLLDAAAYQSRAPTKWHGLQPLEVIAGVVLETIDIDHFLPAAGIEAELTLPVEMWLLDRGYDSFTEVPIGKNRIDVLGVHSKTGEVVGIELKNDLSQMKRGVDQITEFGQFCDRMYLGVTPALAARYLAEHGNHRDTSGWDPRFLDDKLSSIQAGLLLVDVDALEDAVEIHLEAPKRVVAQKRKDDLMASVEKRISKK